jgi:hypothetical protein
MATADPNIGRREAIGFGIESTPGTGVAPQVWFRWKTNSIQPRTNVAESEGALGVVDRVGDSGVTGRWVEGTVGGDLSTVAIGYILRGFFGNVSTGAASGGIYPHTFSNKQSAVPTSLTVASSGPLGDKRHSYGVLDNLEISAETGAFVQFSSALKARMGASSSETVNLVTEDLFTSEHITVKIASDVTGLNAATALKASSTKLNLERPSQPFFPLGNTDSPEFDRGAFDARGEFVVRLTDTQYETDFLANVIKALRISLVNGNKELTFTASKARYRELEKSRDLNDVVTATIQFFCEYDTATGTSITPVLKNAQATYVAA